MQGAVSAVVLTLALAGGAAAQVSTNRVAATTDWSVFVEGNPQECWGVSAPKESVNTKDGKPVAALIDAELFARVRQFSERFEALTGRLAQAYADVPMDEGLAEIEALVAKDRRSR